MKVPRRFVARQHLPRSRNSLSSLRASLCTPSKVEHSIPRSEVIASTFYSFICTVRMLEHVEPMYLKHQVEDGAWTADDIR